MSSREALSQWEQIVSTYLPHLSKPQAAVLAMWSYGMVLAKSCGTTSVAALLAELLGKSYESVRQRLREWCYDGADKKGVHRQEIDVTLCFAPLLRWIVSLWPADEPRLALGMDATTLGQRFTVLCISVLYRGCAIPIAWKIVCTQEKGAWEPYWKALFTALQGSVPTDWTVIVLADRGLYAPWLFQHLVQLGWHPFLRINLGGKVPPLGSDRFEWLKTLVPTVGSSWCGRVDCFVEKTVRCTLLAHWEEGYADPWLILTDLPTEAANVVWYGMRMWIESGEKRYQTRRRALAPNQDDRPRSRQSSLVSHRCCHALGGQCGGRVGCAATLQWVGSTPAPAFGQTQEHSTLATAPAELFCSGTAAHLGGPTQWASPACGTVPARTLAGQLSGSQETQTALP